MHNNVYRSPLLLGVSRSWRWAAAAACIALICARIGAWWLWAFITVATPIIISISEAFGGIPLGAEPPGTGRLRSRLWRRRLTDWEREGIVWVGTISLAGRASSCNLMVPRKLHLILATDVPSSLAINYPRPIIMSCACVSFCSTHAQLQCELVLVD